MEETCWELILDHYSEIHVGPCKAVGQRSGVVFARKRLAGLGMEGQQG